MASKKKKKKKSEKLFNNLKNKNWREELKLEETHSLFLLSSIYIRRKYWIRENFRLPVFDGFTCFEMS